jgi:hypothetical protein
LHELVPKARAIGLLENPDGTGRRAAVALTPPDVLLLRFTTRWALALARISEMTKWFFRR